MTTQATSTPPSPSGVKLYEWVEAQNILNEFLLETEGEVTPELAQMLDELQVKVEEKIERVALYIREQLVNAAAIDEEAKRLAAHAARRRSAADGLKTYLKVQMQRLDVRKVDGLLATVALQNNPPAVHTALEAHELYAIEGAREFVTRTETVVYKLDKAAVVTAHKAGRELPPALAVVVDTHVRIR